MRETGRLGADSGPPGRNVRAERRRHAVELHRSRQRTVKEICAFVGMSRSTLYADVEEFAGAGGTAAAENDRG